MVVGCVMTLETFFDLYYCIYKSVSTRIVPLRVSRYLTIKPIKESKKNHRGIHKSAMKMYEVIQ